MVLELPSTETCPLALRKMDSLDKCGAVWDVAAKIFAHIQESTTELEVAKTYKLVAKMIDTQPFIVVSILAEGI